MQKYLILLITVALVAVAFAGCSSFSDTDQKFINSGNEYIKSLQPITDGSLSSLKNYNQDEQIHYAKQGMSLVDKYLPIISSYQVSSKVQPIKDELLLSMQDYRIAQDNYLKSVVPGDAWQKIAYLDYSNKNLTSSTEHFERMKSIMNNLK